MFFASTVGISPKGVGENPYFFILCLRSSIGIEPEWSVKVCVKFFAVFGTIKRNIYYLCTQKKNNLMNRLEFKTESKIIKIK